MKSVYCAVRTGSLNKAACASSLKDQPLKEFPAFYETRNFLTVFANVSNSICPEPDESTPHPCKCLMKSGCIRIQYTQTGYALRDPGRVEYVLFCPALFPDRLWGPSSSRSCKNRVPFCGTKGERNAVLNIHLYLVQKIRINEILPRFLHTS